MGFIIQNCMLKWYVEKPGETDVTILKGIKTIGKSAFAKCHNLKSVTIPDSVISIENETFAECIHLTSITIPSSVKSIGERAFAKCHNLTSITISDGVTSIENEAFAECRNLTSISIPDSVKSIGKHVFDDTKWLKQHLPGFVILGDGILYKYIGITETAVIPNGVTHIMEYALYGCNLINVTIPESVTSIDCSAIPWDVCVTLQENGHHIGVKMDYGWRNYAEEYYLHMFWFTKDAIKRQEIFKEIKKQRYQLPMAILMAISHEEDELFHAYVKKNIKKAVKHLTDFDDAENVEKLLKLGYVTKNNINDLINYAIDNHKEEIHTLLMNYKKVALGVKERRKNV